MHTLKKEYAHVLSIKQKWSIILLKSLKFQTITTDEEVNLTIIKIHKNLSYSLMPLSIMTRTFLQ